ncbi:hypothetical protein [Rhodoflexus caldus]|uniref:hypothetical protein n=1 Tax=Rhodoflexus caldus TaxID=2891236 RepID=UPI00202A277C|nr:hypothetical protein [Rhodoflexus caldus]
MEDYGWVGGALYIMYILLFVAIASAVILPIIKSLSEPKTLIRSGIGVGIILVLFVVCYLIADGTVLKNKAYEGISENTSKMIGASLLMLYVMFFGAIIAVVYSEVSKFFK